MDNKNLQDPKDPKDSEKKEKWDAIKGRLKENYSKAKGRYQQIKTEIITEKLGKPKESVKNLGHIRCTNCNVVIGDELIKRLELGSSIVCEFCGQSMGKQDFIK